MQDELLELFAARRGHFRLESNHHGDVWLDLELLFLRPVAVQRFAIELAKRLVRHECDVVCGPLIEGSFVGLIAAMELKKDFIYSERVAASAEQTLYPFEYRVPLALRDKVRGKRVAIVNDVINAGSAIRGTFRDLIACGAVPVAIGTLLALGSAGLKFAEQNHLAFETLAALPNNLWTPADCPLCASGIPLKDGK